MAHASDRPAGRGSRERLHRGSAAARGLAVLILMTLRGPESPGGEPPPGVPGETGRRDFRELLGETPVTRAVDRAIEYLRGSQLADGSWYSPGLGKNTGVVGLAALAILSAGHEPGRGPHGESLERTIRWILSCREEGLIVTKETSHGPLYEHAIATILLGEVLGMVDPTRPGLETIHRVHRDAVEVILRAQEVAKDRFAAGGWRYRPWDTLSDISVTGWQLLALRSAQTAGLPVPKQAIDRALFYVKRCQHPSGGFGYMPGPGYDPNTARTGTGVLSIEICGEHHGEEARRGGDWLLKNPLEWKGPFFFYGVYYSTQAMYQLGGEHWRAWRPQTQRILLDRQQADGSWLPPPEETHEREAGPVYTTALAVLSLTVEYRYLPIYQR